MSTLRAWWWKEWRETRLLLAIVLAGVVVGTALPFLLDRSPGAADSIEAFFPLSLIVSAFLIGAELFGREVRAGTLAMALRTPGAMRAALIAKIAVFVAGVSAAVAVEEATRHLGAALTGARVMAVRWLPVDRIVLLVSAIAPWVLVGSVASRGATRASVGFVLVIALAAPLCVLLSYHPWWIPWGHAWMPIACVATAVLAFAITVVLWLRVRRTVRPRVPAVAIAAATAAAVFGLATGACAWAIDRWETPDAHAPEFRIARGFLGEGSRYLYLWTARGEPWDGSGVRGSGTLLRSWVVDLQSGGDEVGDFGDPRPAPPTQPASFVISNQLPRTALAWTYAPVPWILGRTPRGSSPGTQNRRFAWIDARENTARSVGLDVAPDVFRWAEEAARAATPVRDTDGRRVWLMNGHLRRERSPDADEFENVLLKPQGLASGAVVSMDPIPTSGLPHVEWDGFEIELGRYAIPSVSDSLTSVTLGRNGRTQTPAVPFEVWRKSPAEQTVFVGPDGGWRFVSSPPAVHSGHQSIAWQTVRVDDDHFLVSVSRWDVDAPPSDGWFLIDAKTSDAKRVDELETGEEVRAIAPGAVLRVARAATRSGGSRARTLAVWHPVEGKTEPTTMPPEVGSVEQMESFGRATDGRHLLRVRDREEAAEGREAWLLYDPTANAATAIVGWREGTLAPIAIEPDGGFVAVEDGRRVVRFRDGGRERTVLFPR